MYGTVELAAAWAVYFAIHSIWASSTFKNYVNKRVQWLKSTYRLLFNFFAILLLIPVIHIQKNLPDDRLLFEPVAALTITGWILVIAGMLTGYFGFGNYNLAEFTGFYQLRNHHEFHPSKLNTSGLHGITRHPLYLALLIMFWGFYLTDPRLSLLVSGLCITMYLYIGTLFEEKKLINEFGRVYTEYKKNVSMILPLKWLAKKLTGK